MTERVNHIADALDLQVVEQLAGGYFGAFHIHTTAGACAVLKVLPAWPELALDKVQCAVGLVALLRERGYPAPRYLDVGVVDADVYTVQEYLSGSVPDRLTPTTASELVRLWRTHEGAAPPAADNQWGRALIARVQRGEELRSATKDPQVLAVLDRALEVAAAADPEVFRVGDIVHGDFHLGNLLVGDGGIAAVFDWEGARAGDSRADLLRMYAVAATWERADSEVVALLRKELDDTTPSDVRLPIGAEIAVEHLRYGLFARPSEMDWVLREARILLSEAE
ncbi:aminoglycoside phosphotransferase family protein [Actinopolymorpha sp. B11F2]|uniref:phosphotransferase family protein n=1 Tax=Actinopolymorpha sp. B11F2 TaxID=3160862 RepID=UPI0032E3CF07